ncbi:MAG: hypothetical protein IJ723_04360 [Ruminococcus sp.]|nr:hypothetical protein [Ruminococcus sp.]
MKFRLTVKQKLSNVAFGDPEPCNNISADGTFEADSLPFARRDSNTHVRGWVEGKGMRMRTQKDWAKNPKTKALEKQVMVQNGAKPETYVFILEEA